MGMLKEGVRLDRVRGGRQKYRRNPTVNPYQLMLPQSTSHIAPAALEEIKMLEILLNGEPELLLVGNGGCCITTTSGATEVTNEEEKMLVDDKSMIGMDGGATTAAKKMISSQVGGGGGQQDAQEMLSVLSDIYDKELVSVIGWAKQIPGWCSCLLDRRGGFNSLFFRTQDL